MKRAKKKEQYETDVVPHSVESDEYFDRTTTHARHANYNKYGAATTGFAARKRRQKEIEQARRDAESSQDQGQP